MKNARLYLVLPLLLALMVTAFRARPLDERKRETRELAAFTEVEMAGASRVVLVQGSPQKVEIEGPAAAVARFEATVKKGRLHLADQPAPGGRPYSGDRDGTVTVYVTAPTITALSLTGSGSLSAEGPLRAETLDLALSGSGGMTLPTLRVATTLRTAASGSGNLGLGGEVPTLNASMSGSGNLSALELRTKTTSISLSGSGNASLYVTDELNAALRGSGNVRVAGGAVVRSSIQGSGKVRQE